MRPLHMLLASVALSLAPDGCGAPVTALAFSPDGSLLAAASGRNVTFRSAATGKESGSLACEGERATALAFQVNGPLLAVGTGIPGEKGTIRLLDWRQRKWLGALAANADVVTCLAFSPDGRMLGVTSADHSAAIYRIEDDGARLDRECELTGHSAAVQALAFSPDAQTLVTASLDRSLKVWSTTEGKILRSFGQHTEAVQALAFRPITPDRTDAPPSCASGSDDRTVRVWQPTIGRMVRIVRGHDGPVLALAFAPDGRSLFSAGREGIIRRIDADSDEVLNQWRASADWIYSLAISPDGKVVATGDWAGKVRCWSVTGKELPASLESSGEGYPAAGYEPGRIAP
jgi:WD40 repeat protein